MFTETTQTSSRGFVQAFRKRVLGSDLVDLLTGPHGVDRYTELVAPTWTLGEARAKVVDVRRTTPRSVTITLAPNLRFTSTQAVKAGQYQTLHPKQGPKAFAALSLSQTLKVFPTLQLSRY